MAIRAEQEVEVPFQYVCESCGVTFIRAASPKSRSYRFCSKSCYGEAKVRGPEDFWARVLRQGVDECWPWQGAATRGGYGHLKYGRTWVYAHRLAYELTYGPLLSGYNALHSCDNRPCCNPHHLFSGTTQDNINDKVSKGRQPRGDTHYKSILTAIDVVRIRALHAEQVPLSKIASSFGVNKRTLEAVVYRKTWKHVT